jgi:hypothetical protein
MVATPGSFRDADRLGVWLLDREETWDHPSLAEMIRTGGRRFADALGEVSHWLVNTFEAVGDFRLLDCPQWDPSCIADKVRKIARDGEPARLFCETVEHGWQPICVRRVTNENAPIYLGGVAMLWGAVELTLGRSRDSSTLTRCVAQIEITRRFLDFGPRDNREASIIAASCLLDMLSGQALATGLYAFGAEVDGFGKAFG